MFARPAGIWAQSIFFNPDRIASFQRLYRHIGHILRRVRHPLDTILASPSAPGTVDHIDQDERRLILPFGPVLIATDTDHRITAFAGRHDLRRHDRRQGTQHRIDHPIARQGTGRHRRRHAGVQYGAFRRRDGDTAINTGVIRHLTAQGTAYAQIGR